MAPSSKSSKSPLVDDTFELEAIQTEDVALQKSDVQKVSTLGSVQLRNDAGEIILIPTPSNDPNDPLNW